MLDAYSMSLHSLALRIHCFSCKPTPVITVEQILIVVRVCLFLCKWKQFYMNPKALINRFTWPGLPFCARLNIKPCPDLDLSSRPCHYWLTNNQFFWLNLDIIVIVIHCHCSPSLFKLWISYRLARFPHLSQARWAIPAPLVAVLVWCNSPFCHWFSSGPDDIFRSNDLNPNFWAYSLSPKNSIIFFWNDENNLFSSATLALVLYLSIGFSSPLTIAFTAAIATSQHERK